MFLFLRLRAHKILLNIKLHHDSVSPLSSLGFFIPLFAKSISKSSRSSDKITRTPHRCLFFVLIKARATSVTRKTRNKLNHNTIRSKKKKKVFKHNHKELFNGDIFNCNGLQKYYRNLFRIKISTARDRYW